MRSALRFALPDVLVLAEHALTAEVHVYADPDDKDAAPALLLVADDGVYLMSNGLPALEPTAEQPSVSRIRVVYAAGCPSDSDWTEQVDLASHDDLLVTLPLQPALIGQLRTAHTRGADTFTVTVTVTHDQITPLLHPGRQPHRPLTAQPPARGADSSPATKGRPFPFSPGPTPALGTASAGSDTTRSR